MVVSHSPALAAAAVALAEQIGGTGDVAIEVAAGTPDGELGTDAVAIAAAIDRAAGEDGVLVVMDLGSAILSAEMALDFVSTSARVVLSPAPFVEGLVAAAVLASTGASLDAVAAEVRGALDAKATHLGADDAVPATTAESAVHDASPAPGEGAEASFEAVVTNPSGLHARPAAAFVRAAGRHDADVRVSDLDTGAAPVAGNSLLALMSLGVHTGTRIRVTATGRDARAAVDELRALVEDGFGER